MKRLNTRMDIRKKNQRLCDSCSIIIVTGRLSWGVMINVRMA